MQSQWENHRCSMFSKKYFFTKKKIFPKLLPFFGDRRYSGLAWEHDIISEPGKFLTHLGGSQLLEMWARHYDVTKGFLNGKNYGAFMDSNLFLLKKRFEAWEIEFLAKKDMKSKKTHLHSILLEKCLKKVLWTDEKLSQNSRRIADVDLSFSVEMSLLSWRDVEIWRHKVLTAARTCCTDVT